MPSVSRGLKLVVAAAILLGASRAQARHVVCNDGDGPMSLPADLLRTPAPPMTELMAARAAASPGAGDDKQPGDARLCLPGVTDDPTCRPFAPAVPPGGAAIALLGELCVLPRGPAALPPIAPDLLPRVREARLRLDPGHARRIDRPPRSV